MGKSKTGKKHLKLSKKIMLALMAVSLTGGVYFSYSQPVLAADASKVTTITSGTYYGVVGGTKENFTGNENKSIQAPVNTTIAISGGTLAKEIKEADGVELSRSVIGGHYITGFHTFTGDVTGSTENTNVTISGGIITAPVFGGSVAQQTGLYTDEGKLSVTDKAVNVTIKGGNFIDAYRPADFTEEDDEENSYNYATDVVFGGGAAIGGNAESTIEKVNITIGEGNATNLGAVFGGSMAQAGGTANVAESTINVYSGDGLEIIAGGYALGGRLTVPDEEDYWSDRPVDGSLENIDEADNVNTISNVKNSTINLYGGHVAYLALEGYTAHEDASIGDLEESATVENSTVNYYGGTLDEVVASGTKKSQINLYNDLTMTPDSEFALEIVNGTSPDTDYDSNELTVDGQGKYSLNAAVAVNNDLEYNAPKSATLNLNNLKNYNGNLEVFDKGEAYIKNTQSAVGTFVSHEGGAIHFENVNSIEGTVSGDGDINFKGNMNFTNKLNIAGSDVAFLYGNYTGTYNLNNPDGDIWIEDGARVHVANFEQNVIGTGRFTLGEDGILVTTADQLFGENAGDTTITENGNKVLPTEVRDVADDKVIFRTGTVEITANKYSLAYARAALNALKTADDYDTTSLTMTGSLLDKSLTLTDVRDNQNSNLELSYDNATINVDGNKNLVIYGKVPVNSIGQDGIVATDSSNNKQGFSAGAINLQAGSEGVIITGNESLALGGQDGGDVILVDGKTSKDLNIIVGLDGSADTTAKLVLGNSSANATTSVNLTGAVAVNSGSTLGVASNATVSKGVTLNNGSIDATAGQLNSSVAVTGTDSSIVGNVTGALSLEDEDTALTVGSEDKNAIAKFTNVKLNGGSLVLDPSWDVAANEIAVDFTDAEEGTNVIDGKLLVGQNTYATIGDGNDAKVMFAKTGLTFGEDAITAALYIKGNQSLGDAGAVYMDGAMTDAELQATAATLAAGTFSAADNSVTMVDGSAITETAALSGVQTVAIGEGAKLYVDDAVAGNTYHILINDGEAEIDGVDTDSWTDDNLLTNKRLVSLTGVVSDDNTTYNIVATSSSVKDIYDGKVIIGDVVDEAFAGDTDSKAYQLVNAIADDKVNTTEAAQIDAFNSLGNLTALSGATHNTYTVSGITHEAITDHMSLANNLTHDKDVWAQLIHTKNSVSDLAMGGMDADYDSKLNGVVVGADFYHKEGRTLGAAFTYVKGDVDAHTLATTTKTDSKFYGLSLYGGMERDDYALIGDISYLSGSNDVTQYNSGNRIEGSPDTKAFSIGVRAEKRIARGESATLVPYVGARFLRIQTDDYANNFGFNYDQSDKNMFLVPLGVKYSANFQRGNWNVLPIAELGYVWNSGRSVDQTVSFGGVANGFTYDLTDRGSFIGKLGLEASNGNVTYSLGYEYQKGSSVKANRFRGGVNLKF
ncbi:autotransporter domain-containing protein [Veillonella ratti]|uniref:autotransporter domain-containing protein n=1 Tax=Veillonella ratti TaxID=103892 RepID=UPI0013DFB2E8|nr:autotransporter domain-containing protein [Veillonella ratti]